MVSVHWLLLLEEVVENVVGHCDEPFEIVKSRVGVPAVREEQVLEVEEHDLGLLVEIRVKALNRVHPMEVRLPRIDLRRCLDALADVLILRLILQLVLILVELADWKLAREQLRDLLQRLLVLRQAAHREAEAHEVVTFVLMVEQLLQLRLELELHDEGDVAIVNNECFFTRMHRDAVPR